ncbi:MAG: hypothetical protein ABIH69_04120 [bacterium]
MGIISSVRQGLRSAYGLVRFGPHAWIHSQAILKATDRMMNAGKLRVGPFVPTVQSGKIGDDLFRKVENIDRIAASNLLFDKNDDQIRPQTLVGAGADRYDVASRDRLFYEGQRAETPRLGLSGQPLRWNTSLTLFAQKPGLLARAITWLRK